jgi:hypothetical protein
MQAELDKFAALMLDEKYKAEHQRHCPHCGLVAQWTDGCVCVCACRSLGSCVYLACVVLC